jgi:hypothetical protein
MRVRGGAAVTVVAAGLVLAVAGCGHPAATAPAGAGCWQFGLRAIEHHVRVRVLPRACAGLSQAQLNQIVASAVRAAAGPHRKAVERHIAAVDGRYLASLVHAVQPPSGLVPRAGPATSAGPGPRQDRAPLSLIALGCWAATVAAGGYLFAAHRRRARPPGRTPAIAAGHAVVAVAGLAVWGGFAVARGAALAWAAAALVITAAGLGMAVLLMSVPEPVAAGSEPADGSAAGPPPSRVLAIATHATLAVVTVLLVVLAATGAG